MLSNRHALNIGHRSPSSPPSSVLTFYLHIHNNLIIKPCFDGDRDGWNGQIKVYSFPIGSRRRTHLNTLYPLTPPRSPGVQGAWRAQIASARDRLAGPRRLRRQNVKDQIEVDLHRPEPYHRVLRTRQLDTSKGRLRIPPLNWSPSPSAHPIYKSRQSRPRLHTTP
ncbi:unnamed protein product [Protopolystoma xenopodis]|uniref:Uncharacterized protein n=1 Tax=Protopolystoma xenopodis TaxID=117903 RepID=A0A3S5A3K2_9PLAT|nr:unnamed protein product [Protopolystoma xenopodis]